MAWCSDLNHGARSASSNGIPYLIFSTLAVEWKLSASANSQPSRRASSTPMVVFPAPVTPITTTITGTRQESRQGKACLSLLSPIKGIRVGRLWVGHQSVGRKLLSDAFDFRALNLDEMKAHSSHQIVQIKDKFKGVGQECPTHTRYIQSAVDVGGWIVQGDELP